MFKLDLRDKKKALAKLTIKFIRTIVVKHANKLRAITKYTYRIAFMI